LRLGSTGPAVKVLQEALNAALPQYSALGTDGQFGGLTAGRVKTFQGNQRLAADGVVGPATWQALCAVLGCSVAVAGAPAPAVNPQATGTETGASKSGFDHLRPKIVAIARQHIGMVDFTQYAGGKPRGLDFLISMFESVANVRLTEQHFKDHNGWMWRPSSGAASGSRIDWCGIFAVYCYQKAGVPGGWAGGRPTGPLRLVIGKRPSPLLQGTIGVTGTNNHHFVVEDPGSGSAPQLSTIDGNTLWGRIASVKRPASVCNFYEFTQ
jgi:hypothetical protein